MGSGAENYIYALGQVNSAASVMGEDIAKKTGLKYRNVTDTDYLQEILTKDDNNIIAVFFDSLTTDMIKVCNEKCSECENHPLYFCTDSAVVIPGMPDYQENITIIPERDCNNCVVGNLITKAVNEHANKLKSGDNYERSGNYFYSAPFSYFILDDAGFCIDVNRKWIENLGYDRKEVRGRYFGDFISPDSQKLFSDEFSGIQKEGEVNDLRFKLQKKNVDVISVSVDGRAEKNPDGSVKNILCTLRDISKEDMLEWEYERAKKSYLHSYDPMGWLNIDGSIRDANIAATKLLGYSNEELKTMDMWDFYTDIPRAGWKIFLKGLRLKKSIVLDVLLKNSDGLGFPVKINASVLKIKDDELILLHGQETSRIIAQQEVLNRELFRYEKFFSNFQGIVYMSSANGRGIFVKGLTEKITGYREEDFLNGEINWMKLIHPDDFKIIKNSSHEIQNFEGFNKVVDYRIITKSGDIRWVRDSVQNYISEDSVPLVSGFIMDITDQKRAEDELKRKEDRYRTLSNASDQVVAVLDDDNNILFINNCFSDYLEKSPEELEGCRLSESDIPGSSGELQEMYEMCVSSGKVLETNFSVNIKGDERVFHLRFTPQKEYGGTCTYLLTGNDITESIRIEKAVLKANQKLKLLSEITRHDTLNCITALEIYEDMLSEELEDELYKGKLELITLLTRQIENIAVFTRDYQEMGENAPRWDRIDRIVKKLEPDVNFSSINIVKPEEKIEIFSDGMIEKVFYTLFDNAVRHGGDDIDTVAISFSDEKGVGIIRVEDNGRGVISENKKEIFLRGFGENTGLGLFLAKEILSITDIEIEEVGEYGVGACFEIKIPPASWRFVS